MPILSGWGLNLHSTAYVSDPRANLATQAVVLRRHTYFYIHNNNNTNITNRMAIYKINKTFTMHISYWSF